MKKICLWCGKSHKTRLPKDCKERNALMNEACKEVETWVVMRMIECLGSDSLKSWRSHVARFASGSK